MELQVKEDLMTTGLDLADYLGAFCIEKLHTDLNKGLFLGELVKEAENLLGAAEVAGHNYIFTHYFIPPIISSSESILYFSITLGRSLTMSRQA